MFRTILLSRHARPHVRNRSDMSFTVVIVIFIILTWIAGSLLANHYSVYALAPVTFFFLALAGAGCVVYGANLSGSAIAALSGVTGLQFGYLLRLFVPRSGRGPGAEAEARTTGRPTSTLRRSGWGCLGDLFRRAATHKSTNSASVCAGRLSSKQARQTIFKSRLRDQLLRYHRSSSVRLSTSSIVQASPRSPLTSAHPVMPGFKWRRCAILDTAV
jgi:hypothetical protein